MHINTEAWTWAQYLALFLMFLGLAVQAAYHGKPRVDEKTNEPHKFNVHLGFMRFGLWLFILIAGGFFK